ncbi:MAG: long-chain fatty acid--CoA ligase [Thermoleophilia bacterium]|nr:long-chain fatty acid--CoA ligase [Thermoleophilia bacterium]MDH4338805.1 long-chain fatty acid--CoA ligase [Thermoleophilia bacterium]
MTETASAASETRPSGARRTIARLWRDAVAAERLGTAYLVETEDGWTEVSWRDADERVRAYANGLLARGVRKGDPFAILARNSLDWALIDFAFAQIGAVGVPVYASSSTRDVGYLLTHSEAVGIVCEDAEQLAKVEAVSAELASLQHVFTYHDLDGLAAHGRDFAAANPTALEDASAAIAEDDLFTIIYTSGTTGPPKGCMLSHRNYYAMVSVVDEMDSYYHADDLMLLYLPLAHNFGRLMLLTGAYVGFPIAFLADPLRLGEALLQVRPTVLPSVPRAYEKVHSAAQARFDEAAGAKRRLINWALPVGREVSRLEGEGKAVPVGLRARHRIADKLVFSKVRAKLGGRLRIPISGGAPLAREIAEFFDAIGVRIVEGYGLTECTTACSTNRPDVYRFGTVGRPLPGFEIAIADDGEILVRSETVFQGYFKDEEATAAVLASDGWLRTGDIGDLDADGFLRITDRKKDILVTAGGKNVAPQNIENELKMSQYVSQALVVGDERPYVAALVTLDPDEIGRWASSEGIESDATSLAADQRVRDLLQGVVDAANAERSRFEQIKRFAILPRDFTMADGEITPTLKLRRRAVQEHFAEEIEALYAEADARRTEDVGG